MLHTRTEIPFLRGPVPLAHLLLRQFIRHGDQAVDATCGNGKDTMLLAELVGEPGHIWAFDIQAEALTRTQQRLHAAGLAKRATLLACGHEELASRVPPAVAAVVYNLGWLPGSSRTVVTRSETTLPALESALQLLRPGGILLITCYPGHDEGAIETEAVQSWSTCLDARQQHVWRMGQTNVSSNAPFCLLIQKTVNRHAA